MGPEPDDGSKRRGIAIGLDRLYGDWRIGIMVHTGFTESTVTALGSTMDSADYGLDLYGGREWGDTRLTLGAIYTRHDIESTRTVAFPGFTDVLTARYGAGTAQAFAELSHAFDLGNLSLPRAPGEASKLLRQLTGICDRHGVILRRTRSLMTLASIRTSSSRATSASICAATFQPNF